MLRLVEEDMDNNRKWEAEQLAREQRSIRFEKEREDKAKFKEEQDPDQNEPQEKFQYMALTWQPNLDELSPERNDAAEEAERELQYMDEQELLRSQHPDDRTNINAVEVQNNSCCCDQITSCASASQ